jgi:pSer/pThr/pTyr-binding forkhead associated (FHA) protein
MRWQLWRLSSNIGPRVILIHQFPFLIGRSADCHLREELTEVSGHHCHIFEDQGELVIEDMGSCSGTYVNGVRLTGRCQLTSNDVIEFGSTWMVMGVREDYQWIKTKLQLSA